MGLFRGIERGKHDFQQSLIGRWLWPEHLSGNDVNRLGQRAVSRPDPSFMPFAKHPLSTYMNWFHVNAIFASWKTLGIVIRHSMRTRFGHRSIAKSQGKETPEAFTSKMKEFALKHPQVDIVGVTRYKPEYRYEGTGEPPYPWVIIIGRAMDYEKLSLNLDRDFSHTIEQVIGGYERSQKAAFDVANWLRSQGYNATAHGGLDTTKGEMFLTLPHAIEAGFGNLGKHGSIINDQLGSAFRLADVVTDAPLVPDQPRDIASDDFCMSCQKCVEDCPPGAISNEKQWVRGSYRWYVDFDKCVPYMTENKACAICLTTCPYSRPGVAPKLTQKMLRRRERNKALTKDAAPTA